jgi:phosphoglycolate phosphatase
VTDAALFDLDGVLVDSRAAFATCVNGALRSHGLPERPDAELHAFIGPPLHETFARLVNPALVQPCVDSYRARYRASAAAMTRVMPGVGGALERLACEMPLVVATSKARVLAEPLLAALGIRDHFVDVVGPSLDVENETKAVTVGRALAYVPDARDAVMIGDRRFDVIAAKAHGLRSVGVLWGIGSRAELAEAGADALVARADELPALLGA